MLRHLRADDNRFKSLTFGPGLNLVVADRTDQSDDTDSRNGSGKSSLVELIHFLLGAKVDKNSFVSRQALRSIRFELELDWPGLNEVLKVRRQANAQNEIVLDPDVRPRVNLTNIATLAEWQHEIERVLFNIPSDHPGISGRSLLSLYIRRVRSNAFNDPVKTTPMQTLADAGTNLAYLLGLDWQLAGRYKDISSRESTRKQLMAASKDPVWGRIVGRSSELRGEITVVQQRIRELGQQITEFRVVPEYERLQGQADEINLRIRRLREGDVLDRANLQDLERALEDTSDPDVRYIEDVYLELGLLLPDAVTRRFDEVAVFHNSIMRNRRSYLQSQIGEISERLQEREAQRFALDEQLSLALRTLSEGGALDTLTALQQALASEQSVLQALRNRYEVAQTLEASAAEIKIDRGKVESQIHVDLMERERLLDEISVRFREFATRLYGDSGRNSYLEVGPTATHLKIAPHIDSQDSRGIGNMVIFCFDLTVAVTARRTGRGPDFLVHDSHLFDGVDERQIARALQLAKEVTEREDMQYIATLNSDDLAKADGIAGFTSTGVIVEPRLTDAYEDGGLFGFRFS